MNPGQAAASRRLLPPRSRTPHAAATAAALVIAVAGLAAVAVSAVAAQPSRSGATCGVERWAVKTLSDPAASTINFHAKATSVDALRAKVVQATDSSTPRTPPVETTVYRVHATLLEARREADHDIHLVIAQPGAPTHKMIVEFPDPTCPGAASSIKETQIAKARAAFIATCGAPAAYPAPFEMLTGTATISGVAFVDVKHATPQHGVAPNNVELHPVLNITHATC
jgi:hypothetical protein